MTNTPIRLDGWKAIAAHFRRDRSTVMRWAEDADFPVHRVAGRKGASVWAYAHELDAWLSPSVTPKANPATEELEPTPTPRPWFRGRLSILASVSVLAIGVLGAVLLGRGAPAPVAHGVALPADTATADLYLQARDDWSTRTPAGLRKAMMEFASVTSRDPKFAPAYVGLADSYLLAIEFSSMPASEAFPKAEAAAKAALAIDPDSADANRALGFIDYWGRGDGAAARRHFDRSLQLNPNSAQTHFWYGNVLHGMGADDQGLRHMREARLLEPGSRSIQSDYAWALWQHGPGESGRAELEALAQSGPPFDSPHRYLAYIALSEGDATRYLDQVRQLAAIDGGADLARRASLERAAFAKDGSTGLYEMLLTNRPAVAEYNGVASEWSATAASLLGRREQLLDIVSRGERAGEHWYSWRQDQKRFTKWRGDLVSRRDDFDGLVYAKDGQLLWRDEQLDASSDAGLLVDQAQLVECLEHLVD